MQAQHSAPAERNRQPILEVLRQVLPARGSALEIASGTGQHAAWFAGHLTGWTWQPTDADPQALDSITAWCDQLANVRPPVQLDVLAREAPRFAQPFDAVYCANMLHIAPWQACAGLMQAAARHLSTAGVLVTYGPYWEDGVEPAPGNLAFDASLRSRNPQWGIRSVPDVRAQARQAGLDLAQRFGMPANNLLLVFERTTPSPAS